MKCARHPGVETALSCGKCEVPICPKCMIQTPVGARCPSCARVSRVPTYQVGGIHYLRAAGTGLGIALVTGLAWGFIQIFIPFFFLGLLIAGAVGYAIGEVISLSVNRKSGTGLAVIGGVAVIISYAVYVAVGQFFWSWHFQFWDILAVIIGIFVSAARLR